MKAGMLKLTSDEAGQGDLWVQCTGDGNRTLLGMTSGKVLKVAEAASWVRRQLCPPHE